MPWQGRGQVIGRLSHPLAARPHDGENDDQHDENAHQQDAVSGAGDRFTLLKQARQPESVFRNGGHDQSRERSE